MKVRGMRPTCFDPRRIMQINYALKRHKGACRPALAKGHAADTIPLASEAHYRPTFYLRV